MLNAMQRYARVQAAWGYGPGRRALLAIAAGAAMAPAVSRAQGGAFPSRAIRLIVPFAPGGATDISARLVMARASETIGQQIVIENRGGAGGDLAMVAAASAKPDGYTLLYGNDGTNARGVALRDRMPLDPTTAFVPIARLMFIWSAFAVHESVPARTMAEFIAYARARPGQLNYGSAGQGTLAHVATSLFAHVHGLDVVHVPYRGAALAVQDLAAGRLQFAFLTVGGGLIPVLRGPTVRVLAVSGEQRSALFPDAQTMPEAGTEELNVSTWNGVFAPAGTPRPVIDVIARHLERAIADPGVAALLEQQTLVPAYLPPDEFGAFVESQIAHWRQVSARTGIRI